jgi:cellulose biosynthesis protein BcsQ
MKTSADILLVEEDLIISVKKSREAKLVITLTELTPPYQENEKSINKYQCGDVLVNQVLSIYAQNNPQAYIIPTEGRQTKVIAIYSPLGGAGKTTIAVALSIQAAWEGKSVFYLNLENIASTDLYFDGLQENSLSNVLFYLKQTKDNTSARIEAAKCIDSHYRISFYKQSASVLDIRENLSKEIELLVRLLAGTGQYDHVFIDMSSCIEQNSLSVLDVADEILMVCTQDEISELKTRIILNEFEMLEKSKDYHILKKVNIVLNKYEGSLDIEHGDKYCGENIMIRVPRVMGLTMFHDSRLRPDLNGPFGTAIHCIQREINNKYL